jgi:Ni,Fe-hydrogenase I small subunit
MTARAGRLLGAGFAAAGRLPVINIAGCPIHPGWFVDTLLQIAAGGLTPGGPRRMGAPAGLYSLAGPPWLRPQ